MISETCLFSFDLRHYALAAQQQQQQQQQMGWGHAAGDRPAEVVTRMLLAAAHVEFSADPW